ncbi:MULTISPECIES: transcriptional regulator [unclassified Polaromonas]|uniref:transcriptional regulator n=1 Tax=unclassified Polaromonas TaxID=2638319 RepID=UPI001E32C49C|nr:MULTISPECIES: transcriptional regulator [unclassified Polaromonas]
MASTGKNIPIGNSPASKGAAVVQTAADIGELVRERRRALALKQTDVAGLGSTGNRFIIELERGKPTVQLQKALDVLSLLGLEVLVRPKAGGQP